MPRRLLVLALAAAALPAAARADDSPAPVPTPPAAAEGGAAPAAAPDFTPYTGVTTGDEVRVRAGPSHDFRVLERLPRGAFVEVTGASGDYLRVRVPGGVPCFVHPDLVEVRDATTLVVSRADVLLRPTAGKEYFPVEGALLQPGDACRILGQEVGEEGVSWWKVLPPERVELFIHGSLVAPLVEAPGTDAVERAAMERRDAYTGGTEAESARAAAKAREDAFAAAVAAASAALAAAPADDLPPDADAHREALRGVMTESGDPDTRARAGAAARAFVARERARELARVRAAEGETGAELQRRLGEAERRHREAMDAILRASPAAPARRRLAAGRVERRGADWALVKGGVVLHLLDSLRYDLAELSGRHCAVDGKILEVDAGRRHRLLRVDSLEILD